MRQAILLAIARDAELKIRIALFRGAAGGAAMERLGFALRGLHFEAPAPWRHIAAMTELMKRFRTEEDEVVAESGQHRQPIRHRIHGEAVEQNRGINPGEPFDLHRQDEKDVDDL